MQNSADVSDQNLYKVGDFVRHKVFGPGQITGLDTEMSAYIIKFEKFETEREISFKAKLEASS